MTCRSFQILALLAFLAFTNAMPRVLIENYCLNGTTSYRIYAIDAKPTNPTNCLYQIRLTTGSCVLQSQSVPDNNRGYICFAAVSGDCNSINNASMTGIITTNCSGVIRTEASTPITSYAITEEFVVASPSLMTKVSVGFVCKNTNLSAGWNPRGCTMQSGPGTTSFSYSLKMGIAILLFVISMIL